MAIIQHVLKKMIGISMMTVSAEEVITFMVKMLISFFIAELNDYVFI
jgi:hypothetical protein